MPDSDVIYCFQDANSGPYFWAGGSDEGREGAWYWTHSLAPVTPLVWAPHNPNCGNLCNYLCFITLYDYMCSDCPSDYSNAGAICQQE